MFSKCGWDFEFLVFVFEFYFSRFIFRYRRLLGVRLKRDSFSPITKSVLTYFLKWVIWNDVTCVLISILSFVYIQALEMLSLSLDFSKVGYSYEYTTFKKSRLMDNQVILNSRYHLTLIWQFTCSLSYILVLKITGVFDQPYILGSNTFFLFMASAWSCKFERYKSHHLRWLHAWTW